MYQLTNTKYKLSLLSLFIGMAFSIHVIASPDANTEIISLDKGININTVDQRPTIEIAPTNSNGISHNQYEKFNVGKKGIDINNAIANPAKIIINQVISNDKTRISGNINILGDNKPHFIIASPSGINCNDCSVTNVGMLTLTTANMNNMLDNGKITDKFTYDTQSGHIRFKNVKQEKFTDAAISRIFAKSIHLKSSQLNVNDISLIAGKNRLNDVNNPKDIGINPSSLEKYDLKAINLTIDANSTINAKDSYLHVSDGKLDNQGVINSSGSLNISGVNTNILNKNKLISKDQNYQFISTNFANGGMIVGNNINDVTEANNDSFIKLNVNLNNSNFVDKGLIFIDVANTDNALDVFKDNNSTYPAEWNTILIPH